MAVATGQLWDVMHKHNALHLSFDGGSLRGVYRLIYVSPRTAVAKFRSLRD